MCLSLRSESLGTEEVCQLGHHLLNSGVHAGKPALVNRTDSSDGRTLLSIAAHAGLADVVALLLCRGADPSLSDHQGQTALTLAARQGHAGVLQILLTLIAHGAEVDRVDYEGRTPLIAAAYMGHKEAVEILLGAGAQVDLADGDGRTALSVAALCVPSETVDERMRAYPEAPPNSDL
uniref:Uncharacterized protein n=1 Tax=Electrophorus electricus TaxID=8005 RepID=A0A4W4HGQ9_ELEEL